jgi:hypothetical protein
MAHLTGRSVEIFLSPYQEKPTPESAMSLTLRFACERLVTNDSRGD